MAASAGILPVSAAMEEKEAQGYVQRNKSVSDLCS